MEKQRIIHRKEPVSGEKENFLMIFLHGYGADGSDLFNISNYFSSFMSNIYFMSPDAPYDCSMSNFGKEWFPIEKIPYGAIDASREFLEFLEKESESLSIPFEKIILFGFSQGAMLSLQSLLLSPKKLGAVFAFSGGLTSVNIESSKKFINNGHHQNYKTPILLVHGEKDEVVPFASLNTTQELLEEIGFSIKKVTRPDLGHGIDEYGIKSAINLLTKFYK